MATAPDRTDVSIYEGPPPSPALRDRLPRTMAYLGALPAGIHSYPQCHARSGVLSTFRDAMPKASGPLDPFVEALLRPFPRAYVREVVFNAGLLAIADTCGMTDAQFLEWNRATNRSLFSGILYRALMAIFSPGQLLERAPARWESFHRGTTLTVKSVRAGEAVATLIFPERLCTPLILETYAGAFGAALEHARGNDVAVTLKSSSPTSAEFLARWR